MTVQNTDSDLGLEGVPVAIGSGSRASLSAVPSTAAADGTRSMPRKVSRARAVVNLWGRSAIAVARWIAGFWDAENERARALAVMCVVTGFISGLLAVLVHCSSDESLTPNGIAARGWAVPVLLVAIAPLAPWMLSLVVALGRAHSRAVDREVERLSKGGGA